MHDYKNLLDQVNSIIVRYKKIDELTGENFNVFRILKLESAEVRMHSAFIGELLNPNGSHGQKDAFLKLFIKAFCFKGNPIDTESAIVEIEKHTGFINDDKTEGGRIDIIITDKHKNHIIIENKIYAGDQENQLLRYYAYSNSADLIYLTLHGKSPSAFSNKNLEEDIHYKCYSYKNELLKWLESCRKEVAVYPLIREAISHYINLVKHLTHQTINKNMQEELSELLKLNLEAAWRISENLDSARQKLAVDFFNNVKKTYEDRGLKCSHNINLSINFTSLNIWKDDWRNISISIMVHSLGKNMVYGFLLKDSLENQLSETLTNNLRLLPNNTGNGSVNWPWHRTFESPYSNWYGLGAWQAILNGKMKDIVVEQIDELLNLTQNFDFKTK